MSLPSLYGRSARIAAGAALSVALTVARSVGAGEPPGDPPAAQAPPSEGTSAAESPDGVDRATELATPPRTASVTTTAITPALPPPAAAQQPPMQPAAYPSRGFLIEPSRSGGLATSTAELGTNREDPDEERFTVAVDSGLRFHRGPTGAFATRLRIGLRYLAFDARFTTTEVAGLFEGDSARLTEVVYGLVGRYRFRLGRRSTLSVGAGSHIGVARGAGHSSIGLESSFGTRAFDLTADVVYEFAWRSLRLRAGAELGHTWGITLLAAEVDGTTQEIGSLDGVGLGLFLGVGFARVRGRYGR